MIEQEAAVNIDEIIQEIITSARELPSMESLESNENQYETNHANTNEGQSWIVSQLSNEAEFLRSAAYNPYYTELGGGLKGFIKRIIRKLNKPLIFPMSERQNAFNEHTAKATEAARIIARQYQDQLNSANEKILDLQNQVEFLSLKTEELARTLTIYRWKLFEDADTSIEKKDGV